VPESSEADDQPNELKEAVLQLVKDTFEVITSPSPERGQLKQLLARLELELDIPFNSTAFNQVRSHPLLAAATAALTAQADVATLLTEQSGMQAFVAHALFGGGRVNPGLVIDALIEKAIVETRILGLPQTADTITNRAMEGVSKLRQVALGEPVELQQFLVFDGLPLATDQHITTPWGTLHSAIGMRDANDDLPLILDVERASAVLVVPVRVRFEVSFEEQPPFRPASQREVDTTRLPSLLIPFAVLLATVDTELCPCGVVRQTSITPWSSGHGFSGPLLPQLVRTRSEPLAQEELASIEHWTHVLDDHYADSVEIMVRRLCSAAYSRMDYMDRFIDSVIAWENLFGATPESTFRITAAMAKLLKDTPQERAELRTRLSNVYAARSAIVHGRSPGPVQLFKGEPKVQPPDVADLALRFGLIAARALFSRRPDLVSLGSTERGNTLLLG
jgi:Apea-like HEPN